MIDLGLESSRCQCLAPLGAPCSHRASGAAHRGGSSRVRGCSRGCHSQVPVAGNEHKTVFWGGEQPD